VTYQLALYLRRPTSTRGWPRRDVISRGWNGGYFWLHLACKHSFCELSSKPRVRTAKRWPCPFCRRGKR